MSRMFNPAHPGLVLREYLSDRTVDEAAEILGIPPQELADLLNCRARISDDLASRLSELLNTSKELWTGIQAEYDSWQAEHPKK